MGKLPRFKRGEALKFFNKLSKEEKRVIDDYVKYVSITSKSQTRLKNTQRSLITFRKGIEKPLINTTIKDLRNFLASLNESALTQSSRNELKHTIKRFLKWKFDDWSKRFENLSDIKLIMKINEEKINSSTILRKEDIENIIKEEPKLFWKTFFITLYESGLRPIELRTLLWKNIKFNIDGELSEINVYATKTSRARSVYVQNSTYYLTKLKEKSKNGLVFPSPRNPNKPMGKELPAIWLGKISKKVLGRKIYPYILRHSRATELYTNSNIPDKTAQKFLGHSKSMGDVYTHLSNEDVKDAVSKTIYKTEDLPPEKKHELEKEIETLKELLKKSETIQNDEMEKLREELKEMNSLTQTFIKEMKKNQIKP